MTFVPRRSGCCYLLLTRLPNPLHLRLTHSEAVGPFLHAQQVQLDSTKLHAHFQASTSVMAPIVGIWVRMIWSQSHPGCLLPRASWDKLGVAVTMYCISVDGKCMDFTHQITPSASPEWWGCSTEWWQWFWVLGQWAKCWLTACSVSTPALIAVFGDEVITICSSGFYLVFPECVRNTDFSSFSLRFHWVEKFPGPEQWSSFTYVSGYCRMLLWVIHPLLGGSSQLSWRLLQWLYQNPFNFLWTKLIWAACRWGSTCSAASSLPLLSLARDENLVLIWHFSICF